VSIIWISRVLSSWATRPVVTRNVGRRTITPATASALSTANRFGSAGSSICRPTRPDREHFGLRIVCRDHVITALMGGTPEAVQRLRGRHRPSNCFRWVLLQVLVLESMRTTCLCEMLRLRASGESVPATGFD